MTEQHRREQLFAKPVATPKPPLSGQWNQGQRPVTQGPWSQARWAKWWAKKVKA